MASPHAIGPRMRRHATLRGVGVQAQSLALPPDLVLVGQVVKVRGLDGEVKVKSLSDVQNRFRVGASFWVAGPHPARISVASVRETSGGVYLRCPEWPSPEIGSSFRGSYLAIEQSERPMLPDGRYYHDQLIGLHVWTETGEPVGIVQNIWSNGPYDIVVLECGGKERLLPAVKDVVVRVDVAAGSMTVHPPDGWIDDPTL